MPLSQQIGKVSFLFPIALLLVILDQLAKYMVRTSRGFYICNSGAAFGLKIAPLFFYFIWIIIILALSALLIAKYPVGKYPLIFILAGAFSNLLDRMRYGCVIDFIDLKIWPVFNLADIFICLGVFFLIIKFYKK
jgi:signal peptidase II